MNKRFAVLMVLVLALTAALGATASAQEAQEAQVSGTGTLTARGDGRVVVKGTGDVAVSGSGVLKIIDCGGDAVINVTGDGRHVTRQRGDCVQHKYAGFDGSATVSGERVKVVIRGSGLNLSATGSGIVHLKGQGTFNINDREGRWTLDGRRIVITP